jgi:hypothetical protein
MSEQYFPLVEPSVQAGRQHCGGGKIRAALLSLLVGLGLVLLFLSPALTSPAEGQRLAIKAPAIGMFWQDLLLPKVNAPYPGSEPQSSSDFLARRDPFNEPFKELSKERDLPDVSTGQYTARSFVSKSTTDPDGKVVTERYASSTAGNGKNRIHEARHLYSDSGGLEKSSHELHLGDRSRMAVTETQGGNQSKSSQVFRGMKEADVGDFDKEFDTSAKHMPHRAELGQDALEAPVRSSIFDHGFVKPPYHTLVPPDDEEDFEYRNDPEEEDDLEDFWESHLSTYHNWALPLPMAHYGFRHRVPIA